LIQVLVLQAVLTRLHQPDFFSDLPLLSWNLQKTFFVKKLNLARDIFRSKLTAGHRTQSKDIQVKLSLAKKAGFGCWQKEFATQVFLQL